MSNEIATRTPEPGREIDNLASRKREADLTIETAAYWATCLMRLVEQAGLSKNLGGKKYLQVEGWQVISAFAHIEHPIEWTKEWRDESGELIGYQARCVLLDKDERQVGAGESSCGLDAFPCRGKQGSERDKAARSAAQTWAISRALRNKFSYVAKIAGYEPVPAEEMMGNDARDHQPPRSPETRPGGFKTQRALLGQEILAYVNGDKAAAGQILFNITGKRTTKDVTEAEAADALAEFKKRYLMPAAPNFTDEREPGSDDGDS